ncbi:MAG: cytochrome c biogenesis protein CcsA [Planctomycetota bacterium]|nr:cytochrome c biogenesis protein CcsA [Planctomycetota bacterium]
MAINQAIPGYLIYAAMLAHLLAFAVLLIGPKRVGGAIFAVGFAAAAAAWTCRWIQVGHVPLQSLFEVFLTLAMLVFPLSLFCRLCLGVKAEAADALVGLLILFPAAFVFSAEPQRLPPALRSWLFFPHVMAYMLAYVVLAKAAVAAIGGLLSGDASCEQATYKMVRLGFPLLTGGLILGAVWGKLAWGDYWNWDPKELWALATWLVFGFYLHLRAASNGARFPRTSCAMALLGVVVAAITLLWVNLAAKLFAGLHSYAT